MYEAVRFIDDVDGQPTVEGRLISFEGQFAGKDGHSRDSHGTYFDKETNFALDWFPKGGQPVLYHHGLDRPMRVEDENGSMRDVEGIGITPVGHTPEPLSLREDGLWVKAQLDKQGKYFGRIQEMIDKKALFWSGGSADQWYVVNRSGHVDQFPVVEPTLTPTPSNLTATITGAQLRSACRAVGIELPNVEGLDWDDSETIIVPFARALTAEQHSELTDDDFAYLNSSGQRLLPIYDAETTRSSMGQFGETDFASAAAEKLAIGKLLNAANKFDVEIPEQLQTQTVPQIRAAMTAKTRNSLSDSDFAYVDSDGGRHLPVNDAAHVRSAMSRFNQTAFESDAKRSAAWKKILSAAKKFNVEVSDSTMPTRSAVDEDGTIVNDAAHVRSAMSRFNQITLPEAERAALSMADRESLDDADYAHVPKGDGARKLPIHTKAHVQKSITAFSHTKFDSDEERDRARRRLKRAADKNDLTFDPKTDDEGDANRAITIDGIKYVKAPEEPEAGRAAAISGGDFDSEKSWEDISCDISDLLNPSQPFTYGGYSMIVESFPLADPMFVVAMRYDGDDCTYWKIEFTLGDDEEPVLGNTTELERSWVESSALRAFEFTGPLSLEARSLLTRATAYQRRTKDVAARRSAENRTLSETHRRNLVQSEEALRACADEVKALIEQAAEAEQAAARAAYLADPVARRALIEALELENWVATQSAPITNIAE